MFLPWSYHAPHAIGRAPCLVAEFAWLVAERFAAAGLVAMSVPLLLLALLAELTSGPALPLLGAGVLAWLAGVGWGVFGRRPAASLAQSP